LGGREIMLAHFKEIWVDESGQDLAEYGLLGSLVAILVIVALSPVGQEIRDMFTTIKDSLAAAVS
jgi:pilus assembly protein Flp/PilA